MIKLHVQSESWPTRGTFTISRSSRTHVQVVLVELHDGRFTGRGECVPYAHYGESVEEVCRQIEGLRPTIEQGLSRQNLQSLLPGGAARNALDCALWDLEAKQAGKRAWELAGHPTLDSLTTAYTLSLDTPENMKAAAAENAFRPLLKLKLAGAGDLERVEAVHAGASKTPLIVDANEGWTPEMFQAFAPKLAQWGVEMIEQPLPAGKDQCLAEMERPICVCADESCHDRASLPEILGKYDMVNIKLDKTGGLTEALALQKEAQAAGLKIMVGCMLATSLSMAPAMLVAQGAHVVDLDGPLLLAKDREAGLRYEAGLVHPPEPHLWG